MHQAVTRDVTAVAAFQRGIVVGAQFHLDGLEFFFGDAFFLISRITAVVSGKSRLRWILGLVQNARDHQRGTVVVENIADAAFGLDRDLLFEHEAAVDATRRGLREAPDRASPWRTIPACGVRASVSDGDAGQRTEFLLDVAAALFVLRRLAGSATEASRRPGISREILSGKLRPSSVFTSPRINRTALFGA